jgi:hypothetical protein
LPVDHSLRVALCLWLALFVGAGWLAWVIAQVSSRWPTNTDQNFPLSPNPSNPSGLSMPSQPPLQVSRVAGRSHATAARIHASPAWIPLASAWIRPSPLPGGASAAAGRRQQGKLTLGYPLPLPDRMERCTSHRGAPPPLHHGGHRPDA